MGLYEVMWRTDENGQPMCVAKSETIQVSTVYFNVMLDEIPNKFQGVEVVEGSTVYTEVPSLNKVNGENFHVDYAEGVVTFAPSVAGKNLKFNYYGRGFKKINSNRIVGFSSYSTRTIEDEMLIEEKIRVLEKTVDKQMKYIEYLANEIEKLQGVRA